MGSSPKHLTPLQIERLKSELAEVIIANFCYPSFFDYRLDMLRTRPVDRRKRQEVWAYINSLPFGPLTPEDASTIEFRRFVERVFLRYIEMNRGLIGAISARRVAVARSRVSELAAAVIKDLGDFLALGDSSRFGLARPVESWGSVRGKREPTWEQIERSTQLLQTTLVYLRTHGGKEAEGPARAAGATPPAAAQAAASAKDAQAAAPAAPAQSRPVQPAEAQAAAPAQSRLVQPQEAPTPEVPGVGQAVPVPPQREEAPISISALPTQLLPQRPVQSASRPVLGSKGGAREYETVPLEFPSSAAAVPRRQFSPLSRPRTASRPVDGPASAQAGASAEQQVDVASLETVRFPVVSPPGAMPSVGGGPASRPESASRPGPIGGSVTPPVPSSIEESASAGAGGEDEAWLAILNEASGEHGIGLGERVNEEAALSRGEGQGAPLLDSGQVLANGAGSPVGLYGVNLPDLPESFAVASLENLPPDLVELYGEYLRDSRSGALAREVLAGAKEAPPAVGAEEYKEASGSPEVQESVRVVPLEQLPGSAASVGTSYLVAPEKAEVDALIAALADRLTEQPAQGALARQEGLVQKEVLAHQEALQGSGTPSAPVTFHPFQLQGYVAQARGMPPGGAVSAGSVPSALGEPGRLVTPERLPAVPGPVGPGGYVPTLPAQAGPGSQPAEVRFSQAAPSSEQARPVPDAVTPAQQSGALAPHAPGTAPTTVPLAPKITGELQPLPGDEQGGSGEGEGGTKGVPAGSLSSGGAEQPGKEMSEADVLIFVQLQHQVSTWVKIAAVSHQIEITGQDIPELVAELRRMAALEEAELQVVESLVALCQRVTTTRQATMEDYKQAMMLYLLHHRSRLAL